MAEQVPVRMALHRRQGGMQVAISSGLCGHRTALNTNGKHSLMACFMADMSKRLAAWGVKAASPHCGAFGAHVCVRTSRLTSTLQDCRNVNQSQDQLPRPLLPLLRLPANVPDLRCMRRAAAGNACTVLRHSAHGGAHPARSAFAHLDDYLCCSPNLHCNLQYGGCRLHSAQISSRGSCMRTWLVQNLDMASLALRSPHR